MELFLNPSATGGLAAQLYAQLRDAIVEGRLRAGDRLTPSRLLASDLGVSRFTVTEVYARLAAEGYVRGHAGGGTSVIGMASPLGSSGRGSVLLPNARAARIESIDPRRQAPFDMRSGMVDPSLFPIVRWRQCMRHALRRSPAHYDHPAGSEALRSALAHWIARARGVVASPANIVVTSGAQQAVDLVARVLLEPGDVVAVEEPGYPPVVELLRSLRLAVVGVAVDEEGIVVDDLPPAARLVYVTPSHQSPLGYVMSHTRRIELLNWVNAHNAAIVEDDYDSQFRYGERPLEPVYRLDRAGRVIYVATFSKILAPALRVGFAVVPPSLAPAVHALRQVIDWCPPGTTQDALTRFIESGHLDRHVTRARRIYRQRHEALGAALHERLTVAARPVPSHAGLHMAVLLDDEIDDESLTAAARDRGVMVSSLRRTYNFTPPPSGLLVGFGALRNDQIRDAVDALDASLVATTRRT